MSLTQGDRERRWSQWLAWEGSSRTQPMPAQAPIMRRERKASMSPNDQELYASWLEAFHSRHGAPAPRAPAQSRTQIEWDPNDVMTVHPTNDAVNPLIVNEIKPRPIDPVSYFNVQITDDIGSELASRDISRSGAIVNDPDNYYVGVTRASIPLGSLPLTIATLSPAAGDGLTTVYKMSFTYGGTVYSAPLKLIKTASAVIPGFGQPDGYTWIYSREDVAAMKSNCLAELATLAGIASPPPYVSYDASTQLETLSAYPLSLYDLGQNLENTAACVQIGYNREMMLWWRAYSTRIVPNAPDPAAYWQLNVRNNGLNWVGAPNASGALAPAAPATTLLQFVQGAPNGELITCSTIQVRSDLPMVQEFTDTPDALNNTSAATQSIMTDFEPDFSQDANGYQTLTIYNAMGLGGTRWIKMTGHSAVTRLTISLWWVDRTGKSRPLLVQQQRCSLKLAFAHRALVENW